MKSICYDDAGRKTKTVEGIDGLGGLNRTTNFTFTLDNLIATMTAVNSTTGDQTTTYLYGTTLADSGVARNDLLSMTTYPDTRDGWAGLTVDDWANLSVDDWATLAVNPFDSTASTYNRLGQQVTFTDQRNTVRTFLYDKLGRLTDDCVTTVGVSTDNAVLRISTGYEIRGMVNLVTSYDNPTPGSGMILNQVAMTFNSFAQLIEEQQDHNGAVSGSSPSVQYDYDTGGSGSNEIRFTTITYPNGRIITYSFGTSGGMNDYLNRVDTIQDTTSGTVNLATYTYLGLRAVVKIDYPEPQVNLDLWGGTSGVFTGFDLFGRVINQPWYNYSTSDMLDQYQYGYDQNSNRTWKANIVSAAASVPLDEAYTYDNLNRLTQMQRGTLSGGVITGTPTIEQDWTLDPTGNWSNFLTKSAGTTDLNQTRASTPVNEITNITESTGPTWIVPAYDAAGNTTTMPQTASPTSSFNAVYDAWNRMVKISDSSYTVAEYEYDGRGRRIVRLGYTSGVLSETRDFYFTLSGRDVEQRVNGSASMDQQHVWGIRYINELVCRDDAAPQRLYVGQDANFSVTALISSAGSVMERFLYTPYGGFVVLTGAWAAISDAYNWVYLFQGGRNDVATQLTLFGKRDFSSLIGVWIRRDPSGYADSANAYEFLLSSPVHFVDAQGTDIQYDNKGEVKEWHSYEQLLYEVQDFQKRKSEFAPFWSAALKSVLDFAYGSLPEKKEGACVFDYGANVGGNGSPIAPEPQGGYKTKIMTGLLRKYANVSVDYSDLSKEHDDESLVAEVMGKIVPSDSGNTKFGCDIIFYIGHTLDLAKKKLDGHGVGFLPSSCYSYKVYKDARDRGFTGIPTVANDLMGFSPQNVDSMKDKSEQYNHVSQAGFLSLNAVSNTGQIKLASKMLAVLNLAVAAKIQNKECKQVNVHVIWGSSAPSWVPVNFGQPKTLRN